MHSQLLPISFSGSGLWWFMVFASTIIISCKESVKHIDKGKHESSIPDSAISYVKQLTNQEIVKLEDEIVLKGDIEAYKMLRTYYYRRFEFERLLYYSIIMAHKYNSSLAYGDAGDILFNFRNQHEVDCLDTKTKILSTYFLLSANERGNDIGKFRLLKLFHNDSFPRSNDILNHFIVP